MSATPTNRSGEPTGGLVAAAAPFADGARVRCELLLSSPAPSGARDGVREDLDGVLVRPAPALRRQGG